MSDDALKPLNKYELISFKITTLSGNLDVESADPRREDRLKGGGASGSEMKGLVLKWSITESIDNAAVNGKAVIIDSLGVFYTLPIIGQEKVVITFNDFEGGDPMTEEYIIYAVTDVEPFKDNDNSTLKYTIHFVSPGKFISDRFRVRRAITSSPGQFIPIGEQAKVIYDDYYKDAKSGIVNKKEIEIDGTEGPSQIVIPNMKPENAMRLLAKKAYSAEYKTQDFRFFETREKFYFKSIEDKMAFAAADKIFFYRPLTVNLGDTTEQDYLKRRLNIISIRLPNTNTIEAINQGGYYRKAVEAHVMYRTIEDLDYEYYSEYKSYVFPDGEGKNKPIHEQEFVNKHLNYPMTRYILKDDPYDSQPNWPAAFAFRPKTNYAEIFNNRVPTYYHQSQNRLIITINGHKDLYAGDVIELEIPKFYAEGQAFDDRIDKNRSGKYLVEKVINNFNESEENDEFTQTLTVTKGGIIGDRISNVRS